MSQKGKRYATASQTFDRDQLYTAGEALALVKENAKAKFDETIELSILLGIDARKADQAIRGGISLPKGTGKDVRVVVFAKGDKAREARDAGAMEVGDEDLAKKIEGGWTEFDVAVATPDMMPVVGKLGKILGPRGLMPNPKSGTVTPDVTKAVSEVKAGKIEYRNDKFGNIHTIIGKASFPLESLTENYLAVVDEILKAKPSASKGKYIKTITLSSTMAPGVKIDPAKVREVEGAAPEPVAAATS
ncbi:MAG: 50S ribosomal protein L1 [Acidimicrobiia bacterium]